MASSVRRDIFDGARADTVQAALNGDPVAFISVLDESTPAASGFGPRG